MRGDAYTVRAAWDAEARVWIATSEDFPGLCAEAASFDELVDIVLGLVPELLRANGIVTNGARRLPVHVIAERIETVNVSA